jgi:hypothetical protein
MYPDLSELLMRNLLASQKKTFQLAQLGCKSLRAQHHAGLNEMVMGHIRSPCFMSNFQLETINSRTQQHRSRRTLHWKVCSSPCRGYRSNFSQRQGLRERPVRGWPVGWESGHRLWPTHLISSRKRSLRG